MTELSYPAEVSFKAGIKEVVDFISKEGVIERCDPDVQAYFTDYIWIDLAEWNDKLKEWGLK